MEGMMYLDATERSIAEKVREALESYKKRRRQQAVMVVLPKKAPALTVEEQKAFESMGLVVKFANFILEKNFLICSEG